MIKEIMAQNLRQMTLSVNKNQDCKINLQPGFYCLNENININNIAANIVINGNGAVICGTQKVNGIWERYSDKAWFTKIEKGLNIQCLYVNGYPYIMARYPNYVEDEILNGYSSDCLDVARVSTWRSPKGGYIRALHENDWGGNSYKILGKSSDDTLKLEWVGDNNRGKKYNKKKLMVENIFEELDSEKEWFYDQESGMIYIIPPTTIDLGKADVEYGINSEFFRLKNSSNITFENFIFCKSNRTVFDSNYIKVTRSDWSIAEKALIFLNECSNIEIKTCKFEDIGSNCIFIKGKNEDIKIKECSFQNCGASGVVVFGEQDACRDLSTWENHKTEIKDSIVGAKNQNYPRNIDIIACYFCNLGIFEKQSAAITISIASRVTVKGCTIHKLPRAGINICDGSFGGHLFEDNDVFDTVRETGDHGPFNSWGRDRFWSLKKFNTSGKFGKIKKPFALLDAVDTVIINHNRLVGIRGFGIDLDDGSTNYSITNNFCCGVGIKLREGFYRKVENNLIINAALDLHATFQFNDDVIQNNIVVNKNPLAVVLLNKGYSTKLMGNLFVGADSIVGKNPLYKTGDNKICQKSFDDAKLEYPKMAAFSLFDDAFGLKDAPTPNLILLSVKNVKTSFKYKGMTITKIDESLQSLCGLSDCDGLYVETIALFSKFYRFGVRKNDAIVSANGAKIDGNKDIRAQLSKISKLTVVRNQMQKVLK